MQLDVIRGHQSQSAWSPDPAAEYNGSAQSPPRACPRSNERNVHRPRPCHSHQARVPPIGPRHGSRRQSPSNPPDEGGNQRAIGGHQGGTQRHSSEAIIRSNHQHSSEALIRGTHQRQSVAISRNQNLKRELQLRPKAALEELAVATKRDNPLAARARMLDGGGVDVTQSQPRHLELRP